MTNLFHMPIATALDSSGAAAANAKLYFYADGTSTALDTYSDSQLTTSNTNPVIADSSGRFGKIYLKNDQQYKVVLKDSSDSELWSVDDVSGADAGTYAADTGAADAYVITLDPPPSSYFEGMEINTKITNTSTGASTINVNGLGAKTIQQLGAATVTGSLTAGDMVKLIYTGTLFEIISPSRTLTVSDNSISSDKIQGGALEAASGFFGGTGTPDGTLHVHTATAGAVTASTAADDLVVENSAAGGMTFLTPNSVAVKIAFGDPEDNDVGQITYDHSDNSMAFVVNAAAAMQINNDGNVNLGVPATPVNTSWAAEWNVQQLGDYATLAGWNTGPTFDIGTNFYNTGTSTYKFATTDQMGVLTMSNGNFIFQSSASGSANTTATLGTDFRIDQGGAVYINDTANANLTTGLTINQGANDDEILALKSSDVAHGITDAAETDTYASIKKDSNPYGGVRLSGVSESICGANVVGYGATATTSKSNSSSAFIRLTGYETSGTGVTSATADANILCIRSFVGGANRTLVLVDEDGDIHVDGSTTLTAIVDDYDDVALLTALRHLTVGDREVAKTYLGEFVERHAQVLHDVGVITLNDDGSLFISMKGMWGLLADAIRQRADVQKATTRALAKTVPGFQEALEKEFEAASLPVLS